MIAIMILISVHVNVINVEPCDLTAGKMTTEKSHLQMEHIIFTTPKTPLMSYLAVYPSSPIRYLILLLPSPHIYPHIHIHRNTQMKKQLWVIDAVIPFDHTELSLEAFQYPYLCILCCNACLYCLY